MGTGSLGRFRVRHEDIPPDQADALRRTREEFHRVNHRFDRELLNIEIPRRDFDLVLAAFSDWPMEDMDTGEKYTSHVVFIKTEFKDREHLLFKGVACFPRD